MKAIFYEADRAAHFPGLGLELAPGVNELDDAHAEACLAIGKDAGLRQATKAEVSSYEAARARAERKAERAEDAAEAAVIEAAEPEPPVTRGRKEKE